MTYHPSDHLRAYAHRRVPALWCLLVLGILLSHHALMLTEGHAEVMGPQHGALGASALTSPGPVADVQIGHDQPAPTDPHALLGDCLAQQGVLPGLTLLLLLAATLAALLTNRGAALRAAPTYLPLPSHPPSRPPAARRALLQVFLI